MNRDLELQLIQRSMDNAQDKTTTLADQESYSEVSRYLSQSQFDLEMAAIHKRLPIAYVHSTELPEPHSFKTMHTHSGNVIFSRDENGVAKAFHNVCRHRGAKVVTEESGCSKRFTCPYHAWAYDSRGELKIVPSGGEGFPNIDKSKRGLKEIPCVERYGFIWLCPTASNQAEAEQALSEILGEGEADFAWLAPEKLNVFKRESRVWNCNWKIVAEGGLETYHFKFAHKDTIAPYFLNNSCVYDQLGANARVVMTHEGVQLLKDTPKEEWVLRDICHIVYGFMPQTTFLVQKDHIDWIQMIPVAPGKTEIIITSLIPDDPATMSEERRKHWEKNYSISSTTLDEDFVLGEQIHENLSSGVNEQLLFGRNENALKVFNNWVDKICGDFQAASA